MISKKLQKYFDKSGIKYEVVEHRTVYTAYDAAATMKVKLNTIAKSLLVKFNKPFINGEKPYGLAIVTADKNIDLKKLTKVVSAHAVGLNKKLRLQKLIAGKKLLVDIYNKVTKVTIPKEKELKTKFKVNPGAMAAFGSIYKLPVFIDKALKGKVIFSGDSFNKSISMQAVDFIKIENGMIGNFAVMKKTQKARNHIAKSA